MVSIPAIFTFIFDQLTDELEKYRTRIQQLNRAPEYRAAQRLSVGRWLSDY